MLAVKKIVQLMTLLGMSAALALTGCGDGADVTGETVFVHVLNAYPGSSKLTLYGPTGKIASGLPFGQRSEEAFVVNRNTNSDDFLLLLDGAPTAIEFKKQLFSLYPQETATMVVTRRSGEEAAEVSLFRNTRSISPTCVQTFANSLALNNSFMPSELLSYSYQTEWKIEGQKAYSPDRETTAKTRCGPTPIRPVDRDRRNSKVLDKVDNDPWFFPVQGPNNRYVLRWGARSTDPRTGEDVSTGLIKSGIVVAERDSEEFVECMSGAVSVLQEEDEDDPGSSAEQEQCPVPSGSDGETLGTEQVVWDELAVDDCLEEIEYTGFPIQPGSEESYYSFAQEPRTVDGEHVCGYPVRVRTPTQDLVFQNKDTNVPNYIDNIGGYVQVDAVYPIGEQHYFVLFGRPVNPFIAQWNTAATSVFDDGQEFPYPEDAIPSY